MSLITMLLTFAYWLLLCLATGRVSCNEIIMRNESLGLFLPYGDVRVERTLKTDSSLVKINLKFPDLTDLRALLTYTDTLVATMEKCQPVLVEAKYESDTTKRILALDVHRFNSVSPLVKKLIDIAQEGLKLTNEAVSISADQFVCEYKPGIINAKELKTGIETLLSNVNHNYASLKSYLDDNLTNKWTALRPFIVNLRTTWWQGILQMERLINDYNEHLTEQLQLARALKGQHVDVAVFKSLSKILKVNSEEQCFTNPFISSILSVGKFGMI